MDAVTTEITYQPLAETVLQGISTVMEGGKLQAH